MHEVGWCHQCGTFQLLFDAPELVVYRGDPPEKCCVVCGADEPWGMSVFGMPESMRWCAERRHVSWAPIPCEVCGCGTADEYLAMASERA